MSQLNAPLYHKIPIARQHFTFKQYSTKELILKYGPEVLMKVPERFRYNVNPQLNKYNFFDIDIMDKKANLPTSDLKNKSFRIVQKIKDSPLVVFDVKYKFNKYGLRDTGEIIYNKEKFVIAAGCSFTFGEGVEQGKDYPSQLAKLLPSYSVYNYGTIADGPNDFYYKSKETNFFQQSKIQKGIFVWLYISDHMNRMICPTN